MNENDGRARLLELVRDPRLTSDVPAKQASALLAELAGLQGALGAIQAALLVRALAREANARMDAAPAPDVNLSADEAGRRLGLSADWLYKNAKDLPFTVRIGRRVLFSSRGLERWNRQRRAA